MSYAEEVMAEIMADEGTETPKDSQGTSQETVSTDRGTDDTPAEETKPQATETAKEGDGDGAPQEQPDEKPEEKPEDKTDEKPDEKPAPKDTSKFTPREKAEHAFRRQLSRQASKYENIIADMSGKFDKVTAELAEIKKARAADEPVKTRADFADGKGGDDAYIDYLVERRMNAKEAERAAKESEQAAERDKAAREEEELRKAQEETMQKFDANARATFSDEESYGKFMGRVKLGVDNGLRELLDQHPAVRDYVFHQPDGPAVLNEMLSTKESFARVMSKAWNPMVAVMEMHDLSREIRERAAHKPEQPQERTRMPNIGKPGAIPAGHAKDMFESESDDDLIAFVRERRH
jgi:hypothetical protein